MDNIKTYKGKHTGKEIDEAVNNAPQLKTDVDHLNETMGAYSERESITLVPTATGYVINSNGVKTAKSGWAMAEFTAEKGNVYLFKPGATDGNVCVFAEAITSVETRGIDYTYTYNDDGTIATAVATYGGKTHSYTYTWVDGKATIKEGGTVVSELPMTYTTTVGSYSPLVRLNADAELPMDGYCRYMSHFKGNSAIKVVVSYKVDAADLTMKVTRDGVLASISTQLGNLSQKEDETRAQIARMNESYVDLYTTKDWIINVDGVRTTIPAKTRTRVYPSFRIGLSTGYGVDSILRMCDVSHLDTSKFTSISAMFYYDNHLGTIDVSNWDVSNITDFNNVFACCFNVAHLDVSKWDTSNALAMSRMFWCCQNITFVDVSGFVTDKVKDTHEMFQKCVKLSFLDVSNWDTSSVTDMQSTFQSCSSLTTLDVSGWDTKSVTNMYCMFCHCSSLTTLDVSGWDTKSVTNIQNTFYNCSSLTTLKLGEGFGKMKDAVGTLDLSSLTKWTDDSVQTLLTLYDRKTNGMGVITIKLSSQTKAVLGEDGIASLTAKGYTIA